MKTCIGILLLLAGVGGSAACWVDIAFYTDPVTGFAQVGSVWLRYGAVAVLLLLAQLASALAARRPVGLDRAFPAAGAVSALAGAGYVIVGTLQLASVLPGAVQRFAEARPLGLRIQIRYMLSQGGVDMLLGALALLCGWSLLIQSRFWLQRGRGRTPACGMGFGMAGTLYLFVQTFARFAGNYASVYHFRLTVLVFSALAALLFLTSLLRVYYFPEQGNGRSVARCGLSAFYLCTCCELPQTAAAWLNGMAPLGDLLVSTVLGLTGLFGVVCALWMFGSETLPKVRFLDNCFADMEKTNHA